jgi:transposase InsO family protein
MSANSTSVSFLDGPCRLTTSVSNRPMIDSARALMENFFSTWKTELVYRRAWRTRDEAENALFAYIDGWYNTQRIQKKLGWRSPDEFEASYHHPVPAGT